MKPETENSLKQAMRMALSLHIECVRRRKSRKARKERYLARHSLSNCNQSMENVSHNTSHRDNKHINDVKT